MTNVVHAQLFIKLTNIKYCWLKTPSNQPIMAEYVVDHPTNRGCGINPIYPTKKTWDITDITHLRFMGWSNKYP